MTRAVALATTLVLPLAAGSAMGPPAAPSGGIASAPAPGWTWPVSGGPGGAPRVLEPFDPPRERWLAGHRGADLESGSGAEVLAPAGGIVAFVGTVVDRPVLTIDHGDGLVSSFEPVTASFPAGAAVTAGQAVGIAATGGHCSGRCIHWGLRLHGEYIDPLNTVTDRRPSVLLPVPRDGPSG
ncbi:murein hydrolase activator EnvC family protein [Arthrobacter sp. KK5.5]|uniref:murein hydrolase activator EnvC family protein n=1 Tax=Arthrobacter sp. KK5.5 TaxID=3373084 RepID=UPI003EE6D0D4